MRNSHCPWLVRQCRAFRPPVTAKEDQGKAVLAVYIAAKEVLPILYY